VAETARRLIRLLDAEYALLAGGDLASLEACWKWRLGLLGRSVAVEGPAATHHGRLLDLTFDAVELQVGPGQLLRLPPETVRHIHPADKAAGP
jgi:BirA family biotin operon repressor/biotin-[acetyl-CoA-carboxylase] ligase